MLLALLIVPSTATAARTGRSTAFPPGWNQLAKTPPMGWRSWNCWGARVSQDLMSKAMSVQCSYFVVAQRPAPLRAPTQNNCTIRPNPARPRLPRSTPSRARTTCPSFRLGMKPRESTRAGRDAGKESTIPRRDRDSPIRMYI